ncbi:hypothetical protein QE152_g15537 [Popillia japonica]|uniref:Uncharacterized protein n=1 Tax=Popillia japonica TaxID=7064 RepID=A0AAW1L820_POPJA
MLSSRSALLFEVQEAIESFSTESIKFSVIFYAIVPVLFELSELVLYHSKEEHLHYCRNYQLNTHRQS